MFLTGTTVVEDKHQGETEEETVYETPEAAAAPYEVPEPSVYTDPTPVSCSHPTSYLVFHVCLPMVHVCLPHTTVIERSSQSQLPCTN